MVDYANRGMELESLIDHMNTVYRHRKVALIQKIPAAWLPVRGRDGRIVAAKIDRKSGVDYMGVWHRGAIAFEVKSTMNKNNWSIGNLTEDQFRFLVDHSVVNRNAFQFVLLGFMRLKRCYLLDLDFIQKVWGKWQDGGKASVTVTELEGVPSMLINYPFDYLRLVEERFG